MYPSRGGAVYFLCFAQGLLQPAGSYLPDVFGDRVQPAHKEMELFLRYIRGLLFGPWPAQPAVFPAFVKEQISRAGPQQSFDAVRASSAEKEQGTAFEWVEPIIITDDLGKSLDPFTEIYVSGLS